MSPEISTNGEADERIAALERRIRDMEALVKGLTAELLDLKTVTMAKSRQDGERSRRELNQGTVVRGTISPALAEPPASSSVDVPAGDRTVILQKGVSRQDGKDAPAEPAMVRIMQSDGTMKMEPRRGNKKTIWLRAGRPRPVQWPFLTGSPWYPPDKKNILQPVASTVMETIRGIPNKYLTFTCLALSFLLFSAGGTAFNQSPF
jgi:hypothetical protein